MIKSLEKLNILPPLIASLYCAAFSYIHSQSINYYILISLFLITWAIYFIDALADVNHNKINSNSARHAFAEKYFFNLSLFALALLTISLFFVVKIPLIKIKIGFIILAFTVFYYFIFVKNINLENTKKDMVAALIFTISILLLGIYDEKSIFLSEWVLAILFMFLIIQHFIILSQIENQMNDTMALKTINNKRKILGIQTIILLMIIFFFTSFSIKALFSWSLGLSALLNAALFQSKRLKNQNYRLFLDLILLLPLLVFFFFGLYSQTFSV